MIKTLLDRVRVNLDVAKYSLSQDDECHLDEAEYQVQQAVEKLLKEYISRAGVTPRKTHDISVLYREALGLGLKLPPALDREMLLYAATLTDAEAANRYASSYLNIRSSVEAELQFAENLFEFLFPSCHKGNDVHQMKLD